MTIALMLCMAMYGHVGPSDSCTEGATFEVGKSDFLLDGKHFVIKAAEIHYLRIPHQYWEHRIKMCKAMGMNT